MILPWRGGREWRCTKFEVNRTNIEWVTLPAAPSVSSGDLLTDVRLTSADVRADVTTKVVTRAFRSSTREGLRPFLIIASLQHSSNSAWLGGFVSIVWPLPRQGRFASALPSPHTSTVLSACPPTNSRFLFFDASASVRKVFLSHCILARITACTAKKRVLFGPRDVDCDSAHAATSPSLPVDAFVMVGSMWHSTSPFPHRYFSGQGDLQKLSPLGSLWVI